MLGIDLLAATVRSSRKLFGLFFNFGHLIGLSLTVSRNCQFRLAIAALTLPYQQQTNARQFYRYAINRSASLRAQHFYQLRVFLKTHRNVRHSTSSESPPFLLPLPVARSRSEN
jgi:hypothetical protein